MTFLHLVKPNGILVCSPVRVSMAFKGMCETSPQNARDLLVDIYMVANEQTRTILERVEVSMENRIEQGLPFKLEVD